MGYKNNKTRLIFEVVMCLFLALTIFSGFFCLTKQSGGYCSIFKHTMDCAYVHFILTVLFTLIMALIHSIPYIYLSFFNYKEKKQTHWYDDFKIPLLYIGYGLFDGFIFYQYVNRTDLISHTGEMGASYSLIYIFTFFIGGALLFYGIKKLLKVFR